MCAGGARLEAGAGKKMLIEAHRSRFVCAVTRGFLSRTSLFHMQVHYEGYTGLGFF